MIDKPKYDYERVVDIKGVFVHFRIFDLNDNAVCFCSSQEDARFVVAALKHYANFTDEKRGAK